MNKKVGVFIPARLSSERLPNKLILPMGDSCLFEIACKKLNNISNKFNKYALLYDKGLINIAKKYTNIKIIIRSKESAMAETPLSFLFEGMKNVEDTHLMFLNPCLAFLKKETIEKTLEDFQNSSADYGTSVKPLQNWIMDKDGNVINEINYKELTTKKIDPLWQFAHCFHIFNKDEFFEDGYMLKDGFKMLPVDEDETTDVDTYNDYLFAKWRYENEVCN